MYRKLNKYTGLTATVHGTHLSAEDPRFELNTCSLGLWIVDGARPETQVTSVTAGEVPKVGLREGAENHSR